jgi:hydroxylamine dehydrogenase
MTSGGKRKVKKVNFRIAVAAVGFFLCAALPAPSARATEAYARQTGKGCVFCHQQSTGGQLRTVGFAFIRNGYQYPISERVLNKAESLQTPLSKTLRFVIGYLHLLAGVIFFGAIFYIHIFIRPTRLKGGIPKAERILGLSCMAALTLTGTYLTWVRMDRWEQFFNNTFGFMLLIKILLFMLMLAIGLTAVTVVHRRMKSEALQPASQDLDASTPARSTLGRFDGSGGKPAYIVFADTVYDVSQSARWKEGRHFGKHSAGTDLTAAMAGAPHGPEVLAKVKSLGPLAEDQAPAPVKATGQRLFVIMAYTNLVIIFLILTCIAVWRWDFPIRLIPETRPQAVAGQNCVSCHLLKTPGVTADWQKSVHAKVGVDCNQCHQAKTDDTVLKTHLEFDPQPISAVVSPVHCAGCHPQQAEQFGRSKHAHTHEIMWKIDPWLKDGMNNATERVSGCYACHGTVVQVKEGRPVAQTWPNVGIGRINPDGSKGSCSSCHTRHKFSIAEARKPEACDQCHLGPDHPQIEIYNESKHGTIYHAEANEWDFNPDDRRWQASRDFRAPTCAACHMSAATGVPGSHDVTERLSWETQAPLTVRPGEFAAFPAASDWKIEREKMKMVCRQCHSQSWTNDHFSNFDSVVENYNENYFKPVETLMQELRSQGLVSTRRYFDEDIEWEFYEFWHYPGRRARMGAAMMAPDYAWWHGFYELKQQFPEIFKSAAALRKEGKGEVYPHFPGRQTE